MDKNSAAIAYIALSKAIRLVNNEHKTDAWINLLNIRTGLGRTARDKGVLFMKLVPKTI